MTRLTDEHVAEALATAEIAEKHYPGSRSYSGRVARALLQVSADLSEAREQLVGRSNDRAIVAGYAEGSARLQAKLSALQEAAREALPALSLAHEWASAYPLNGRGSHEDQGAANDVYVRTEAALSSLRSLLEGE